jgi:hypothetical protein
MRPERMVATLFTVQNLVWREIDRAGASMHGCEASDDDGLRSQIAGLFDESNGLADRKLFEASSRTLLRWK